MLTYEDIARAIKEQSLAPAYLLSGEEPLFIDKLCDAFLTLIPEEEQEFNLSVLYGNDKELTVGAIVNEMMRFPMLLGRILVLVKDAQQVKGIEELAPYLERLPDSTCLVLAYRKKVDKRKALYKAFDALGTYYESTPLPEGRIPSFIQSSAKVKRLEVSTQVAHLIAEHTGNDLEKILGELDKLSLVLGATGGEVTASLVEEHIGISKEYNNFELKDAVVRRDAGKAFKIAYYFASNERANPIQATLPLLFNFFAQLLAVYYLPDRSEGNISRQLSISPYVAKELALGAQRYTAGGVFSIIRQIRLADAASKGVDSNLSGGEILKELLVFIFAT